MIVKDEAASIRATLESVRSHIDHWSILDTGSTDGTQDIIREVMTGCVGERDVVGALHEEPFIDFAASRNRVLDLDAVARCFVNEGLDAAGRPAIFTLMLSGDEVLEGGTQLREFLEAQRGATDGAYLVELRSGSQRWTYTRVLRADAGWRYVGAVHERPVGPSGETGADAPLAPGARVVHRVSDPRRRARRVREFDLPTLTRMVEDESRSLDDRSEAIFHLAETHAALGAECGDEPGGPRASHLMAAMALYWRCGQIAENSANRAYDRAKAIFSYFRYFNVAEKVGLYGHEELLARLEPLAEMAPRVPEIRYMVAVHAAQLDTRRGLFLAEEAARVAREAASQLTYLPTDSRVEWMSLRVAAACAGALKNEKRARELVAAAVAAGMPREVSEGSTENVPADS
jgi:hypothetical protein